MAILTSTFMNAKRASMYDPETPSLWEVATEPEIEDVDLWYGTTKAFPLVVGKRKTQNILTRVGPDKNGEQHLIPIGQMASPELAEFVVEVVNERKGRTVTNLTPEELAKATDALVSNTLADSDLKEAYDQARKREYAAVSMLRQAREDLEQTRKYLAMEKEQRRLAQNTLSDFKRMNALQETTIMHLKNKLDALEKEKAERLARESGTIKQTSNGRRMRFKEKGNDEQN